MKIFLACPYGNNPIEQQMRFEQVTKSAGRLMEDGHIVYSPITYGHTINKYNKLGNDLEFWIKQNEWIFQVCDCLAVLRLPDWQKSLGIKKEIELAKKYNKEIWYLQY